MADATIRQIRSNIEDTKAHISQTVTKLEGRWVELRDIQGSIQRYPLVALGVSVAAGFLVAKGMSPLYRNIRASAGNLIVATLTAYLSQQVRRRLLR